MAINGPFKVQSAELFPHGAYAVSEVAAANVFKSEPPVQERDRVSGKPLWSLDVMDADPEARKNARMFRVKIAADVQPVLPEPIQGTTLRPVVLEGLAINAYLPKDDQGKPIARIEYSVRATGVAPKRVDASKAA